jgi:hypothetical protein
MPYNMKREKQFLLKFIEEYDLSVSHIRDSSRIDVFSVCVVLGKIYRI